MFNDVQRIISSFQVLSNRKTPLVTSYILGLMVIAKKHTLEAMGKMAECHPSRFSVFLNDPKSLDEANQLFNRALRRRIAKLKVKKGKSFIIIDATFTRRCSKYSENTHTYYTGSSYIKGHKWVNIIFVHGLNTIPLASIPIYSKEFCKAHNLEYRTEPEIVIHWLDQLPKSHLFSEDDLKKICFLADSGYDCKKIQRAILSLGSHFVMALKSSRTVKNCRVTDYFKRHKKGHSSSTIRFKGSGKKRITFQVRLATDVHLKGVGHIHVVCSKGKRGSKTTVKYLGSSARLSARNIVKYYRARWVIETWHKEVKQKFGFRDCSCRDFNAIQTHVQLVLVAYILRPMVSSVPYTIEEYQAKKTLIVIRKKVTQFGQIKAVQSMISEKLQAMAA